MKKKLKKKEHLFRSRAFIIVSLLIILAPMIRTFFFDRYYDIEQFFVPDIYNYDIGKYAELSVVQISQQFTSREDYLSGFDLQLSGEKDMIKWIVTDADGELIREGDLRNSGESKISEIRFAPIEKSKDEVFVFTITDENLDRGVLMAYSDEKFCQDCSLEINGILVDGNLSMVPVYKSENVVDFVRILTNRIRESISPSD